MIGVVLVPVALGVLLTACSGSNGSKASSSSKGKPAACAYVAKLDTIAAAVATTDVRNPDLFNESFTAAVNDYVKNLSSLRAVAPADLSASLTRVEADVKQYRFDAALTDRAPLDAYAARDVRPRGVRARPARRAASSGSTVSTATTVVTAPVSSTSTPDDSNTPSTAPSDG